MALDFVFKPRNETTWGELRQGDLLVKNATLSQAISKAHSYYADAEDYTHFIVLTQSCDLVKRKNSAPKARYITLAAVRPLEVLVRRYIEKYRFPDDDMPVDICDRSSEYLVRQALERLLHQTEPGYFLIKSGSHPNIQSDLCAFLALSIPLRFDHYESCVNAKIAELDDVFQAKIGELTGNLYSRVGTPALEEVKSNPDEIKQRFYEDVLYANTLWLSSTQRRELKKLIEQRKKSIGSDQIDIDTIEELLEQVPEEIDLAADRAVKVLTEKGYLSKDSSVFEKASKTLKNDKNFQKLVKSAR